MSTVERQLPTVEARILDTHFPNPFAARNTESELHCVQSQHHGGSFLVCGWSKIRFSGDQGTYSSPLTGSTSLATELCVLGEPEDVSDHSKPELKTWST